jgi:hypothetical protein
MFPHPFRNSFLCVFHKIGVLASKRTLFDSFQHTFHYFSKQASPAFADKAPHIAQRNRTSPASAEQTHHTDIQGFFIPRLSTFPRTLLRVPTRRSLAPRLPFAGPAPMVRP